MSGKGNILPNGGPDRGRLSEERLMAWLNGTLSPEEQHEVEQWLADEGMEGDAMEGLKAIGHNEARHSVDRLNHDLRKNLLSKKRKRKALKTDHYTWVAIAIILLLAVVAYIAIRKSI